MARQPKLSDATLSRRGVNSAILGGVLAMGLCGCASPPSGAPGPSGVVQFDWAVQTAQEKLLVGELTNGRVRVSPDRKSFEVPRGEEAMYAGAAFEPMTVVPGTAELSALVDVLIQIRGYLRCGVVIDTRALPPLVIREAPALPSGQVIVLGPERRVAKFEPSARLDRVTLLRTITDIAGAK